MSLPAAFRRPVLLIVGCGDVGQRVLPRVQPGWRVRVLTSSPGRREALRQAGATPLLGNLDQPASLRRLAGLADAVLMLAPPPVQGAGDPRTAALLQALARSRRPTRLVYGSTTGVYGDAGGSWVDESRPVRPLTPRAQRRVAAERLLRAWGRRPGHRASVLRIPGIYAADREGGDPRERVRRGTPVLRHDEDVFTNHIQADDLARACVRALFHGAPQRSYHVCDDSQRRAGDHYDVVADHCGLPRLPRIGREEAQRSFSPMQMSFLAESRRLRNTRMKKELRLQLLHPDVRSALPPG